MAGYFIEALHDLHSSGRLIGGVSDLPELAMPLQAAAVALVIGTFSALSGKPQQIWEFVQTSKPLLAAAEAALDGATPGEMKQLVSLLQGHVRILASALADASKDLSAARDRIDSLISHDLAVAQAALDGMIHALQTRLRDAKSRLALSHSEKVSIEVGASLLNPFVPGASPIATGWLSEKLGIQEEMIDLEHQINNLGVRIAQFQQFKVAVDGLRICFIVLSDKFEFIKIRVDFIADGVAVFLDNLGDAMKRPAARLYLQAAKLQLQDLAAI